MHWEILVIPLIAFGVWILGSIFRGAEEAAKERARRRPGEDGPAKPRRGGTDLDRFLEEARRRREAAEQAKAGTAATSSIDPFPSRRRRRRAPLRSSGPNPNRNLSAARPRNDRRNGRRCPGRARRRRLPVRPRR
jgi:hypothetical protein